MAAMKSEAKRRTSATRHVPDRAHDRRVSTDAEACVVSSRLASANSTADRALDILLLFTLEKPVWSSVEIAEHFDMPRSTAHRYINSLRSYALLVENASGGWHLGPRLFPLARAARAATSIVTLAAPFLRSLNDAFGEAVMLYERIGHDSIVLDRNEAQHRVKLVFSRGQILPWPGAASSKVLLAFAPPSEQEDLISSLVPTRYTSHTIGSVTALRKALARIVKDGFAYSDQERDEGVRAIAAPVFERGIGRYCITMSGPLFRMTDTKIAEMTAKVVETAAGISEALQSSNA